MREDILNIRDVWQEGYQRLLEEARASGQVQVLDPSQERRGYPRFTVHSSDVATRDGEPVDVRDMSVSGLSFVTANDHVSQRYRTLSLANAFSTEIDIVACDRLQDNGEGAPRYRVRCRFRNLDHGLQFLTLALELNRIEAT